MKKTLLSLSFFLFALNGFSQADLVVTNSDNQTQFHYNSTNTYAVVVSNAGPNNAVNVVVDDQIPPGNLPMTWSGSNGTSGSGALHDAIANLAVGQTITYTVMIQVGPTYSPPDPTNPSVSLVNLINTVKVSSDTPDQDPTCPACTDVDTPAPNYVTVTTNDLSDPNYTQKLVSDILINSPCVQLSNYTSSASCGFGYFNRNNSNFPFKEGLIVRTGNAKSTQGKYNGTSISSTCSNVTDAELQAINCANGNCNQIQDASFVKFNFVASSSVFSFNYLFASNEYGPYQCGFSDAFAFILIDITLGGTPQQKTPHNLAIIPGTNTVNPPSDGVPISVSTIRQKIYNPACNDSNPTLFDKYNESPVANVAASTINMKGQTVPMTASAPVIPGHTYSVKLVIGDYIDNAFDSAVFIEAGSFKFGQPNITSGNGVQENVQLCQGNSVVIKSGDADLPGIKYSWALDGVSPIMGTDGNPISGQDTHQITVTSTGIYAVSYEYQTGCKQIDNITVVDAFGVPLQDPNDLNVCQVSSPIFDLTQNVPVVIGNQKPNEFNIDYYHSLADASNYSNPITNVTSYTGSEGESIYMSVEYIGATSTCIPVKTFKLHGSTAAPTGSANQVFVKDATLNALVVSGSNIKWYSSATGSALLSNETALEDGVTYYASQIANDCESITRLAVTAQSTLGLDKIAVTGLTYNPNPVKNRLNIQAGEAIDTVSVINILGQELYNANYDAPALDLDMSAFNSGTYFVKVQAGSKSSVFRIIKE